MLTDAGFPAVEARNGDEAVAQIYLLRGKVHLVVSDVAMPCMTGNALAATLAERWPHLPVLLISGALAGDEPDRFLRKPFTPKLSSKRSSGCSRPHKPEARMTFLGVFIL